MRLKKLDIQTIKKEKLVQICFYAGILLAFFGSLHPWFLWPLGTLYPLPSGLLIGTAMLIAKTTKDNWFTNDHFLAPVMGYVAISTYMLVINETNINGYIVNVFHTAIFYSIFRLKTEKMEAFMTFLCKVMGGLLLVSIPAFFLYLVGFPFVGVDAVYGDDLYSYTNYFLFMIDDRTLWAFFPRFSSVFLEPGHLGTAATLLLSTQFGKWKKWYNIVLLVALLLTFSLAAYVIYVVVIFLKLWVQRKQFIGKLIMMVAFISTIVVGSFFYNNGENLLHDLILIDELLELLLGAVVVVYPFLLPGAGRTGGCRNRFFDLGVGLAQGLDHTILAGTGGTGDDKQVLFVFHFLLLLCRFSFRLARSAACHRLRRQGRKDYMVGVHDEHGPGAAAIGRINEHPPLPRFLDQTLDRGRIGADHSHHPARADQIAKADVDQFHLFLRTI